MSGKARWLLLLAMVAGARAAWAEDAPKKYPVVIQGHPATVWASSTLAGPPGDPDRYCAKNAFDGDLKTAWVEGAPGGGYGEGITVEFDQPTVLLGVAVYPGYLRSFGTMTQNLVPSAVRIVSLPKQTRVPVLYSWELDPKHSDHSQVTKRELRETPSVYGPRIFLFEKPLTTNKISIEVADTMWHGGKKFDDCAISEWRPIFGGKPNWSADAGIIRATEFLGAVAHHEALSSKEWLAANPSLMDPEHPRVDDADAPIPLQGILMKPALGSDALARFIDATRDLFLNSKFGNDRLLNAAVWRDGEEVFVCAMPKRVFVTPRETVGVAPYVVFGPDGKIVRTGFRATTWQVGQHTHLMYDDALPDLKGL